MKVYFTFFINGKLEAVGFENVHIIHQHDGISCRELQTLWSWKVWRNARICINLKQHATPFFPSSLLSENAQQNLHKLIIALFNIAVLHILQPTFST